MFWCESEYIDFYESCSRFSTAKMVACLKGWSFAHVIGDFMHMVECAMCVFVWWSQVFNPINALCVESA